MDPITAALVAAAIQTVSTIVSQLAQGTITDAQAQAYLKAAADHFNATVATWNATPAGAA